uniref:CSON001540 protein n=1 Tax=Culicoides sonorensis TaxID=179676 RepID=A0A336MHX7_CULSO
MAQFVLVNVVVAVLMKHLEESHRQLEDDELDELERILEGEVAYNGLNPLCIGFGSVVKLSNDDLVKGIKKVNSMPECFSNINNTKTPTDIIYNLPKCKNRKMFNLTEETNNCINSNLKTGGIIKKNNNCNNEHDDETENSLLLPQKTNVNKID